jgi:ABC-2 type transport system permease protein
MNKIFLIAQREYLTRVRKKAFLVSTILLPLLFIGMIFGSAVLTKNTMKKVEVAIVDPLNQFTQTELNSVSSKTFVFKKVNDSEADIKANFTKQGYNAYSIIPKLSDTSKNSIIIQSESAKGDMVSESIERRLNQLWDTKKLTLLGIDVTKKAQYESSTFDVEIKNANDENANGKLAGNISRILGILIYFVILIYGSQVMMSVMEEKTNRIAEVIVSSVKPFQLMMGKLLGVGMVALTQFILWIVLIFVAYNVFAKSGNSGSAGAMVEGVQNMFKGINVGSILVFFLLYFIGGFFFYASIYAALGSAVNEDMREAQQLSFPITMLVIFSLLISQVTTHEPTSALARWASMIPICSPFVMMSRIPYGVPGTVPWWEIVLSLVILYGSILLVIWASAKIYRTGILMYGKKVTFKELLKWIVRK